MKDNIKVSRVALERLLQEIKALEGHLSDAEIAAYCLNLTTPEEQQRSDAEIAAYCLNLTTPEEQQRIEAHLRSCAACAEEVAEHQKAQAYWASDENRARVRDRRERVFAALGLTRPPISLQVREWLERMGLIGQGIPVMPALARSAALEEGQAPLAKGQTEDGRLRWSIDADPHTPGGIVIHLVTDDEVLAGLTLRVSVGDWTSPDVSLEADPRFPNQWGADLYIAPQECAQWPASEPLRIIALPEIDRTDATPRHGRRSMPIRLAALDDRLEHDVTWRTLCTGENLF
ncbi:MAG: zf-HC2 domain-containing protein, partial [Chloroflexi bacterium]|nr:zf-HC2 domain-containing protein [Chloroflexota bacterium]